MAKEKSRTPLSAETLWNLKLRGRRGVETVLIVADSRELAERVGRAHCDRLSGADVVGRGSMFISVEPAIAATAAVLEKPVASPDQDLEEEIASVGADA